MVSFALVARGLVLSGTAVELFYTVVVAHPDLGSRTHHINT
jgi:hypothetical protein